MRVLTNNLLAQVPKDIGTIGGDGLGPFDTSTWTGKSSGPLEALATIVSFLVGVITVAAGIYFIFMFIIGGYEWLSASGDKSRLTKAQDRLTHAIIGLLIVVGGYAIISLTAALFGFKSFLDPASLLGVLELK